MISIGKRGLVRRALQTRSKGGVRSSAVCVAAREGVAIPKGCEYIPGEGWVKWSKIFKQVDRAFNEWRVKKSLQGVRVADGWERREAHIEECVARKRAA